MTLAMTPPALLADLARRGFTVRTVAGAISVTPASVLTPEDRDAIRTCRAGLLAILSPGEPWDSATAVRLMETADALVERLGVDGRHPAISSAAGVVLSAHSTRDMKTIRLAVGEFEAAVRVVAASPPEHPTA